jgi:hypothetical protein
MFQNKGLGHKRLKKRRFSLVETKVSIVEKNVWITERFFDNHYKLMLIKQQLLKGKFIE